MLIVSIRMTALIAITVPGFLLLRLIQQILIWEADHYGQQSASGSYFVENAIICSGQVIERIHRHIRNYLRRKYGIGD
jgi:hypothetical protein